MKNENQRAVKREMVVLGETRKVKKVMKSNNCIRKGKRLLSGECALNDNAAACSDESE